MELLAELVFTFLAFVLGASFASFIYRVTFKYSEAVQAKKKISLKKVSVSLLLGESQCEGCGRRLNAIELTPVFGYLLKSGKCSTCSYEIPWKYPVSELFLGSSFALLYFFRDYLFESFGKLIFALVVFTICFAFTIIDIETRRVPNIFIYPLIVVVIVLIAFVAVTEGGLDYLTERLIAALLGFGFVYLANFFTRNRAFGWGDSKFLIFVGLVLGRYLLVAIYVAVIVGAIVGVVAFLLSKRGKGKKDSFKEFRIPFIPFLSLGTVLMYIVGDMIWDFLVTKFFSW